METRGMNLYSIEESLEQLAEARALAEAEGDAKAVHVIDSEIEKYLTKETAKIDSYASWIRRRLDEAELCKMEARRLLDRARTAEVEAEKWKQTALRVMERFGVKELKTPRNTLRVQANGGVPPLKITEPREIPCELRTVTVEFRAADWDVIGDAIDFAFAGGGIPRKPGWLSLEVAPDRQRIREVLERGNSVAGAELAERGRHVRVL